MIPNEMTAVHFLGGGRVRVDRVPTPVPAGRDVIVRVRTTAICGTDRENLEGAGQTTIPGHESAGEVVAVDRPSWIRVGMRVAVNCHVTCLQCEHCLQGDPCFCDKLQVIGFDRDGGFAEFVRVPEHSCMVLPDDISFDEGSLLTDVLGTAYRAVSRAKLVAGSSVAIWGAGPVGLCALMVSKMRGMKAAVIDVSDARLAQARELGADATVNGGTTDAVGAIAAWAGTQGPDACFDCAGNEMAARQAISAVKKRGTVVVVGVSLALTINPWEDLICRELTVLGTRNFNLSQFEEMIGLLHNGLPATRVITHRYSFAEAETAFAMFRTQQCQKVVLSSIE